MAEDAPEIQEQVELERRDAELAKAAAKEKQNFMEELITTVSPNVLFKTQEDTKLQDEATGGGMKELKEKYDNLKVNGQELGFSLPDINLKGQQPPAKQGPGADKTNHAIQRYQVIAKNPSDYEEGSLVVHDHRLNGTQVSKQQQLNT